MAVNQKHICVVLGTHYAILLDYFILIILSHFYMKDIEICTKTKT
jgi:hypothetical protein